MFWPSTSPRLPSAVFWITVIVTGIAFFRAENEWQFVKHDSVLIIDEEADIYTGSGDVNRRIGFSLMALLGVWLCWRQGGSCLRIGVLARLILLLLAWCAASLLWSSDPGTSTRRLLVMAFCCAGAFGIARQLDNRQWCMLVVIVTSVYAIVGVLSEISLGVFQPLSAGHRFSGTTHPNNQALYLVTLTIAALGLTSRRNISLVVVALAAVGLLVLTKSRTAFAALALALLAASALRLTVRARLGYALALAGVASLAVLATQFSLLPQQAAGDDVSLLGRKADFATLTGRVPLWRELVPYLADRPVLGYGYQSFWNRERYFAVARELDWAVANAHSAYMETVLNLGLVGVFLLLAVVVVAVFQSARQYRATGSIQDLVTFSLLVMGMTHAVLEATMIKEMYAPVLIASRVVRLGFFSQEQSSTETRRAAESSLLSVVLPNRAGGLGSRMV